MFLSLDLSRNISFSRSFGFALGSAFFTTEIIEVIIAVKVEQSWNNVKNIMGKVSTKDDKNLISESTEISQTCFSKVSNFVKLRPFPVLYDLHILVAQIH